MTRTRRSIYLISAALIFASTVQAQDRARSGSLRIVVKDPSGAVIPGALMQVQGTDAGNPDEVRSNIPSDGQGVALAADLKPGRYMVAVSFPGFETQTLQNVQVRAGENRREVTLPLGKYSQSRVSGSIYGRRLSRGAPDEQVRSGCGLSFSRQCRICSMRSTRPATRG